MKRAPDLGGRVGPALAFLCGRDVHKRAESVALDWTGAAIVAIFILLALGAGF
jgi:hypothetical protein